MEKGRGTGLIWVIENIVPTRSTVINADYTGYPLDPALCASRSQYGIALTASESWRERLSSPSQVLADRAMIETITILSDSPSPDPHIISVSTCLLVNQSWLTTPSVYLFENQVLKTLIYEKFRYELFTVMSADPFRFSLWTDICVAISHFSYFKN